MKSSKQVKVVSYHLQIQFNFSIILIEKINQLSVFELIKSIVNLKPETEF